MTRKQINDIRRRFKVRKCKVCGCDSYRDVCPKCEDEYTYYRDGRF